jgi:hypothetical protein
MYNSANCYTSNILCLYSYFLHSISHPNKHGLPLFNLSQDVKAHIDSQENMTENQVKLERVIRRTYAEYGLSRYPITEGVRSLFKAKLWRMGQWLAKVGSIKRKIILDGWKDSTWEIQIVAAEVNIELSRSKEVCEQHLLAEKQTRIRLEDTLKHHKTHFQRRYLSNSRYLVSSLLQNVN